MTRYITLAEYLVLGAEITTTDPHILAKAARAGEADSALHAPAAGFAGEEFYHGLIAKAAVLAVRLVKNHPLPDGNKRTAWATTALFLDLNGAQWLHGKPPTAVTVRMMEEIAAADSVDVAADTFAAWLHQNLILP